MSVTWSHYDECFLREAHIAVNDNPQSIPPRPEAMLAAASAIREQRLDKQISQLHWRIDVMRTETSEAWASAAQFKRAWLYTMIAAAAGWVALGVKWWISR